MKSAFRRHLIPFAAAITVLVVSVIYLSMFAGRSRMRSENMEQKQINIVASAAETIELGFFSHNADIIGGFSRSKDITELFAGIAAGEYESGELIDTSVPSEEKPVVADHVGSQLSALRIAAEAELVYVLDEKGTCIASAGPDGIVEAMLGTDYSFRPYYEKAIGGEEHIGFAMGVTTRETGIYFSTPVRVDGEPKGVAVLKKNLSFVSATLKEYECPMVMVTADGIVIESNREEWLYHSLYPLGRDRLRGFNESPQYAGLPLSGEGILPASNEEDGPLRAFSDELSAMGWKIVSIIDPAEQAFLYPQQRHFFYKSLAFLLVLSGTGFALFASFLSKSSLKADLNRLYTAVEQSTGTVVITDTKGRTEYVNPSFTRLTGYRPEEVQGKKTSILKSGHHDREFYRELWETIEAGSKWQGEFYNRRKDGSAYWESALISPVKDRRGKITNYVAFKEDITDSKEYRDNLSRRATYDELTGVLNRHSGLEELEEKLRHAQHSKVNLTAGFVDANGLKQINDKYGHEAGDELIRRLSETIRSHIRESDNVARIGGDEFLLILPGCGTEEAKRIWDSINAELEKHRVSDNCPEGISASPGFADLEEHDFRIDSEELLKKADERMYRQKERSKADSPGNE